MTVSSVSTPTLTVPTSTAKVEDQVAARNIKAADAALYSLLQNGELLKSLADQSSVWLPPSKGKIMATLWGLFNASGSFLTKDGVQRAVQAEGGGTAAADALWSRLSPDKKDIVNAGDFAVNEYLSTAIISNLSAIHADVETTRQEQARLTPASGTLFDFYTGGIVSILDRFV